MMSNSHNDTYGKCRYEPKRKIYSPLHKIEQIWAQLEANTHTDCSILVSIP